MSHDLRRDACMSGAFQFERRMRDAETLANERLQFTLNGIGIAPEYQDRIFRLFQRLHTAREYEGTGIGLAIVKKGCSKLGGSVSVVSNLDEGSTFTIRLPNKEK